MNWEALKIALLATLGLIGGCVAFLGPGLILGFLFGPIVLCLWLIIVGLAFFAFIVYMENVN